VGRQSYRLSDLDLKQMQKKELQLTGRFVYKEIALGRLCERFAGVSGKGNDCRNYGWAILPPMEMNCVEKDVAGV
jgi:hypothetical protein